MRSNALLRATALAAIVATGASAGAWAQTAADPHPVLRLVQATPPAAPGAMPGPGAQPGQPGMMPPGGMGHGMMGGTTQPGTMGAGQAAPPAAPGAMPSPGAQTGQPGMMPPGGMGPGMMGGTTQPGTMGAGQAAPPAAPGAMPGPGAQPGQPGMMPPGGMGPGMMGGMMQPGMMGGMPMMAMQGHMMKVMFAIADVNGDGALSFEEVTTMHKRIFDNVDANRDGKVTPMEFQAFMRD